MKQLALSGQATLKSSPDRRARSASLEARAREQCRELTPPHGQHLVLTQATPKKPFVNQHPRALPLPGKQPEPMNRRSARNPAPRHNSQPLGKSIKQRQDRWKNPERPPNRRRNRVPKRNRSEQPNREPQPNLARLASPNQHAHSQNRRKMMTANQAET